MTGRWGVGVVVSAAVVASACSGGDGDAPAAPLEPTESIESIVVESSVVATTTTSPSPSTTSTTSTTEPPPTTTLEDLRLDIEADLNEGERVFIAGGAAPGDPGSLAALADYFIDASLEITQGFYREWALNGWTLQPNPAVDSSNSVLEIVESSPGQVRVLACRVDAAVLVDGTGTPVNDEVLRYTNVSTVVSVDGVWRLSGGETVAVESGGGSCGS
ncbi:MAG: hypothetical protein ACE37B_10200 [Ilumatobacter sp.]|uniref:hypothetical protein n=1 Tax=Ilumatobacter sp. TaxID=1967498 RepID=UPI003918B227